MAAVAWSSSGLHMGAIRHSVYGNIATDRSFYRVRGRRTLHEALDGTGAATAHRCFLLAIHAGRHAPGAGYETGRSRRFVHLRARGRSVDHVLSERVVHERKLFARQGG